MKKKYERRNKASRKKTLQNRTRKSVDDLKASKKERNAKIKKTIQDKLKANPDFRKKTKRKSLNPDKLPIRGLYPHKLDYINLPMELIVSKVKLSASDISVYGYINCFKKHGCFLTARAIAGDLNLGIDTVRKSIKRLSDLDLVESIPFHRPWKEAQSHRSLITTGDFSKVGILHHKDKRKIRHKQDKEDDARQDLKEYKALSKDMRDKMKERGLDIQCLRLLKDKGMTIEDYELSNVSFDDIWKLQDVADYDYINNNN